MRSPVRIFDPAFRYVPSWATDIRETFKRASEHVTARKGGSQTVAPRRAHGSGVHRMAEIQPECAGKLES